jgi:hypothetical protein
MRFFSKVVFILNICFIIAAVLRLVENANKQKGIFDGAIKFQPLESTLVIMGYSAIFVNILFNFLVLLMILFKIKLPSPIWLIWTNFFFVIAQFIYSFFT